MKLDVGKNIRKMRRDADITQEELAERLGVSYQAVSRWENGSTYPDIELLPVLAGMFDCTLDELMGGVKNEKIKRYHEEYNAMWDRGESVEAKRGFMRRAFAEFPNEFYFGLKLCYLLAYECDVRDETVADELHRVATDILDRCTDNAYIRTDVIESLVRGETDERLGDILERYVPHHIISRSNLLRERLRGRGDTDAFDTVTEMDNIESISHIFYSKYERTASSLPADPAKTLAVQRAKLDFLNAVIGIDDETRRLHPVYADGVPDAWFDSRMLIGHRLSCRLAAMGRTDEALDILEDATDLYVKFFSEVTVGTVLSYRASAVNATDTVVTDAFLDDGWRNLITRSSEENAAALEAIHMPIIARGHSAAIDYASLANREGWEWFDSIREHPRYLACMERMKAAGYVGDTESGAEGK